MALSAKMRRMVEASRHLMQGRDLNTTADLIGVTPETLRGYLREAAWKDAQVFAENEWAAELHGQALTNVAEALADGDMTTTRWFLGFAGQIMNTDLKSRQKAQALTELDLQNDADENEEPTEFDFTAGAADAPTEAEVQAQMKRIEELRKKRGDTP